MIGWSILRVKCTDGNIGRTQRRSMEQRTKTRATERLLDVLRPPALSFFFSASQSLRIYTPTQLFERTIGFDVCAWANFFNSSIDRRPFFCDAGDRLVTQSGYIVVLWFSLRPTTSAKSVYILSLIYIKKDVIGKVSTPFPAFYDIYPFLLKRSRTL